MRRFAVIATMIGTHSMLVQLSANRMKSPGDAPGSSRVGALRNPSEIRARHVKIFSSLRPLHEFSFIDGEAGAVAST